LLVKKLTADDAAPLDQFGTSTAISATQIVIGAYGQQGAMNQRSGAAYVYSIEGGLLHAAPLAPPSAPPMAPPIEVALPTSAGHARQMSTLQDDKVVDDSGAKISMVGSHGGANQLFFIEPWGSKGHFRLKIKSNPDKCADLWVDRNLIYFGSCHNGDMQKFYLQNGGNMDGPNSAAELKVVRAGDGKCVDYDDMSGKLHMSDCDGGANQKFYML